MNVSLFIILIVDAISIITKAEASPGWRWNGKPKDKHWIGYRNPKNPICSSGQCVLAWKCPEHAISRESTGSCTYWTNGPWVCCDLTVPNRATKTAFESTPSTSAVSSYSNQVFTNSWKQKSTTERENYGSEEHLNTPCLQDSWNRNSRERPTPISSIADVLGGARGKSVPSRPAYNPTKIPLNGIRKTTASIHNKRTTPTSFITKTTRNKTHASGPRIVFPTESVGWTQKVTKHPAFSTQKPRTSIFPNSKSTPKTLSTEEVVWKSSTRNPGRTATTRSPQLTVPSRTWIDTAHNSGERRNNPTSTTTHSLQDHGANSRATNGQSSSRTTARTTSKYRKTTPLPNVNMHLCGTRNEHPVTNRQGRNYNREHNPAVDFIHTGSRGTNRTPYQRIVGGEESKPFSWPWVAALYKVAPSGGNRFLSAGSLINENFVLTAAHVFTPDDLRTASYVVMLGTHDAQEAVAEYFVSSVLLHPDYEHRYYYHDIALLRLERPVTFNGYVMPVCLPSPNAPLLRDRDLEGKNVTVMGWGDDSFGGKSSRVLREATFPIVSRSNCNASYVRVASNRFPRGITEEMLCAGDPNGGKDACQGDSGGPLTSFERGRHTQVGIVSFGYQCGDKEFPGVYIKVAPYLSWIAENTRSTEDYINDYDYRG